MPSSGERGEESEFLHLIPHHPAFESLRGESHTFFVDAVQR
jgi:hypothetical protein